MKEAWRWKLLLLPVQGGQDLNCEFWQGRGRGAQRGEVRRGVGEGLVPAAGHARRTAAPWRARASAQAADKTGELGHYADGLAQRVDTAQAGKAVELGSWPRFVALILQLDANSDED